MIFRNQSSLSFKVLTYIELSGAESCRLRYRKPSGIDGYYPLTIADETGGILRYNAKIDDLDESGWWTFWAHITFIDGRNAPGEAVRLFIGNEGEG